jgi:phage shock protein A
MIKRLTRIFKSNANAIMDKLEEPIKIMEQVIADSRKEVFKLFEAYEEIKSSIEKLEKVECDEEAKKLIQSQKEKLTKSRDALKKKIEAYKAKIIETQKKIDVLKAKNKAYDAIISVQKNLSKFDFDSDLSAIERMEEKINRKEATIRAYDDMEGI